MSSRIVGTFLNLAMLAFAWSAGAQDRNVGLSAVRAQLIENESVPGFPAEVDDRFGAAFATGDFDGDGFEDLATGIPGDDGLQSLCTGCGAVVVRYGAPREGLEIDVAPTFLSPELAGMPNEARPNEGYGTALAAGDFNGDGTDDLAVGVPYDQDGAVFFAGAVMVHYGRPDPPGGQGGGIELVAEHVLRPGEGGIPGSGASTYIFGNALAAGDFDGDGIDDLAVAAPLGNLVGTVTVFHGRSSGLLPFSGYFIHQDMPAIPDVGEAFDKFGEALAAGNFNGDAFDDLAIGVPAEDGIGFVLTIFGSSAGLAFHLNLWFDQDDIGFPGGPAETGDAFGRVLAAGNFDGDGYDDLAIGTPFENLCSGCLRGDAADAGQVNVLYGTAGLAFDLARTQGFYQVAEDLETGDLFGWSLAAGDFNADGRDDLGIAHLGESSAAGTLAGAVTVILGNSASPPGLCCRVRTILQGRDGFPGGVAENERQFGYAMAAGDFDADGHADLAIGAPSEDVGDLGSVGVQVVLYGSAFSDGFGSGDTSLWTSATP